MIHIKSTDAQTHRYNDGLVQVTEFNFAGNDIMNDADITISGRYPLAGYAVNDISTAFVSVEAGWGTFTIKDSQPRGIEKGDRLLIEPGEAYTFKANGTLAIRYVATPAWTINQARTIEE